MSEWKEHNITEVCNTISDTYRDGANKVVLINTSDVLEGKITNHELVPNKNLAGQFKKKFQKNDILYSEIRPANRRYAYVDFDPKDYIASTKLMVLRSKPCILPKYLYYLLTNNETIRNLHAIAIGRSGTFPQITYSELANIKFLLPSIKEQEKILSILLDLDDKIAVNRRICENLEAQAQALFKHWFIDFAPFKDGKFVESELGMIPEGWRVGKLEDVSSFISRGLSPKYQTDTNEIVLGQTCVRNNIVTLDNAREHNPKQNTDKRVQKWDVLLNSTGIGSLGRVGVVYFDDNNVCFDSHLTVVRSRQESFRYYLGRNLLSRQKEIENMAVGSTGQTELPKKDVLVMPILIPSDSSLASFNVLIDDIGNEMYSLLQENRRLAALRDTLLPKLMSGQIKL